MPATHQEHMRHHRACKGKAHASGIGKQLNKTNPVSPSAKIIKIATGAPKQSKVKTSKELRKQPATTIDSSRGASEPMTSARKLSRNSTSSWEYSDSDSLNSSEPGLSSIDHHNNGLHEQTNSMIRRIDRVLDDIDNAKCIYEDHHRLVKMTNCSPSSNSHNHNHYNNNSSNHNNNNNSHNHNHNYNYNNNNNRSKSSTLTRGSAYSSSMRRANKKETWADSLRSGISVDDRIKKMEEGWDDSNVIRIPRERKCHRITAEIENDTRDLENLSNKRNSVYRRNSSAGKVVKRSRGFNQAPLYDVVEWEELLEMALTTRNGKRKRESHQRNRYDGGYLKDLEVLRSSVAPRNVKPTYVSQLPRLIVFHLARHWRAHDRRQDE